MNKKLNETIKELHSETLRPGFEADEWDAFTRSISLTPSDWNFLDQMKFKMGISRSAFIRILVRQFADSQEKDLVTEDQKLT